MVVSSNDGRVNLYERSHDPKGFVAEEDVMSVLKGIGLENLLKLIEHPFIHSKIFHVVSPYEKRHALCINKMLVWWRVLFHVYLLEI